MFMKVHILYSSCVLVLLIPGKVEHDFIKVSHNGFHLKKIQIDKKKCLERGMNKMKFPGLIFFFVIFFTADWLEVGEPWDEPDS